MQFSKNQLDTLACDYPKRLLNANRIPFFSTCVIHDRHIWLQGVGITAFDCPICLNVVDCMLPDQQLDCTYCDFFSPEICPLIRNPLLVNDLRRIFTYQIEIMNQRSKVLSEKSDFINIIHQELELHGLPLHYSLLSNILTERYPEENCSAKRILFLMANHPEQFQRIDEGVYTAI